MKYQFQFAGAGSGQAKAQPRKSKRTIIMAAALFLLVGLACYQYFFRMTHTQHAAAASYTRPVAAVPAATVASPMAAPVAGPAAALPVAVEQLADAGAQAVGNLVTEAAKAPVMAVPNTAPVEAPAPAVAAVPVPTTVPFKIVAPPPARRAPRVLTPEQQMNVAAQIAMDNMLKMANKYPDAYGFGPMDSFEEAKLGQPIPVYTVAETDRAAYQPGQPLKPILTPAKEWVYPVLAGGRICCMVQVSSNGHEFIPGKATKALALAWTKINELWPEADGFHPVLVVNPRIPGYYFTIPEAGNPNITDTVQMFYSNPSLSPAEVILASWR